MGFKEDNIGELKRKQKRNPNNEIILKQIKARQMFICSASMLLNPDYIDVIKELTGVNITVDDIRMLSDKYKKKFKNLKKSNNNVSSIHTLINLLE